MNAPTELRRWLDDAWYRHDREPQPVLDGLFERAPALPDDGDGAEALFLAEHVALAHMADGAALERLLPRLPAHAALARGLKRSRWELDTLAGRPAPDLPDALRWQALGNVVLALALGGRVAEARVALFAPEAAALASEDGDARRAFASSANNVAGGLRGQARRDAARDVLMIEAAVLSRRAWALAGTWMNVERADYQLAMCHAVIGEGDAAVRHGMACLARCEAEGADAYERFFAHECLVQAHRAAGDAAQAARHRELMVALLAEVGDAANRAYCEQTLAKT
jgi:hypothetical protein